MSRSVFTMMRTAGILAASLALVAACGSSDPLAKPSDDSSGDSQSIVVGSQAYYSNTIVAEIYAQTLEKAGFKVDRQFEIGQRDAYLKAMESGEVDLLPEYTGNLLQFYDSDTTARSSEDVAKQLPDALPDSLTVLDYAEAQDADSYNVTKEFSTDNNITSLADLADYSGKITVGGNAELQSRPYGPDGLKKYYHVDAGFKAIGDSGGPLTKDAIRDGTITMGDIYSADPDLATGDFVTLKDPQHMILAQNVVPLVRADLADKVADALNPVSKQLSTEDLIALNAKSVNDKLDPAAIASAWLKDKGLA